MNLTIKDFTWLNNAIKSLLLNANTTVVRRLTCPLWEPIHVGARSLLTMGRSWAAPSLTEPPSRKVQDKEKKPSRLWYVGEDLRGGEGRGARCSCADGGHGGAQGREKGAQWRLIWRTRRISARWEDGHNGARTWREDEWRQRVWGITKTWYLLSH
jgi:hypothetical protein